MRLPVTSYAVLGMLARAPMSRYDLLRIVEASVANFWTIAKSQIYGELDRLERLGYVAGTDVRQKQLPDKRIYEVTPAGHEALSTWLASPEYEPDRFRSSFLVKVFFADGMPPDVLVDLLTRYRDDSAEAASRLEAVASVLEGHDEMTYQRATALLGLEVARTCTRWAQQFLDELAGRGRPKRQRGSHGKVAQ